MSFDASEGLLSSITWLEVFNFRNFEHIRFDPDPEGLTVITGENGSGKTSLLEAIGYVATQSSFRHSPRDALVRANCAQAIIRIGVIDRQREEIIEIEIDPSRRDVVQRNRQRITHTQQIAESLKVTVFTPDDLVLIKDGPGERRQFLDEILVVVHPKLRPILQKLEKILRQRNVLLRQANGRLSPEIANTLEIWDIQLAEVGERVVEARKELVIELLPRAQTAFKGLTRSPLLLQLDYQSSYSDTFHEALLRARANDLRRGVSTVGPQRDDMLIRADNLDARTRLSQGRQRAVTLALRLAAHDVVARVSTSHPVLLLDDVFSELDGPTSEALFSELPTGQTLLTTAGILPMSANIHRKVRLDGGKLADERTP